MSQLVGRLGRGIVKTSLKATALVALLSTSSAWAAVSKGAATYAPPQSRSVGDFSTEYSEYNAYSITDNASAAVNINVSHKAVNVGYKNTKKPVVESHVAAYSQASWNKGANRSPSVPIIAYHTLFGQSLPSEYGTDKSTASTLINELNKTKQLTQSFQFFNIPIPVYGPITVTVSAGANGTASCGSTARASTAKGLVEKSSYNSDSGLSTSGALGVWGRATVGTEYFASLSFTANFTVVSFTAKFSGESRLEHNSATNVRYGTGLEGEYTIGSGSGNVQLGWTFLKKFYGGLSGTTVLASWPPLYEFKDEWADYGVPIMGDAGDAW